MVRINASAEIDRQNRAVEDLPSDFVFPLFNAREALESQRRSGYRDTAAAMRELIDNSYEAGADEVHVVFDTTPQRGRSGVRVSSIAIIDNGSGMIPLMARYALCWGGGTHFEDHELIGRFGFGLPNASINQTKRVEVYTRTQPGTDANEFTLAWLDVTEFSRHGVQAIPEPTTGKLPAFVSRYVERNGLDLTHGTVVVWQEPDRLTYRTPAPLKQHLIDDFAVVYRYMLQTPERPGMRLVIEGVEVRPIDPLFLTPGALYFVGPDEGGAIESLQETFVLRLRPDEATGEMHLSEVETAEELADVQPYDRIGSVVLKVARFPVGLVDPSGDENAKRRWEIRKSRRGMSFVRSGRELQTVDIFPRSTHDKSSGLGDWPLLQAYAYHWGVELSFGPELDEVFGITNDKQGVRPVEDLWRVLHQREVDQALHRENAWQSKERKGRRGAKIEPRSDQPTPAEIAAANADRALSERQGVPKRSAQQAKEQFDRDAEERAKRQEIAIEDARKALEREAKRRRYRVEYADMGHGPFYEPLWSDKQIVVKVNREHPFFTVLYGDLATLAGGGRAKESVDLLLVALARAELNEPDEEMADYYATQRRFRWSPFLETAIRGLDRQMEDRDSDESEDSDVTDTSLAG